MRWCLVVAAGLIGSSGAGVRAQDWDAVFPNRSHEFGTVARGSKVRHAFPIVNTTGQTIHIESFKPKCGCTDVRLGAREIPPGAQTTVEAIIDTTQFVGPKPSGFTLNIDRPTPLVVDYSTTCFIQGELTLSPGVVDFGVVNRSAGAKATLTLNYTGARPDWAIMSAWTISEHIKAELTETGRSPGGAVTYQLTASLFPTAPVGSFKDEITLKTNDPATPKVPVSVAATVQSNVVATPSVLNLGTVRPGEALQRAVIVRSGQPFSITGIESTRPELEAKANASEPKSLHSLALTLKAPAAPGPFNASLAIQSSLKDEPPTKVLVFATVVTQ